MILWGSPHSAQELLAWIEQKLWPLQHSFACCADTWAPTGTETPQAPWAGGQREVTPSSAPPPHQPHLGSSTGSLVREASSASSAFCSPWAFSP